MVSMLETRLIVVRTTAEGRRRDEPRPVPVRAVVPVRIAYNDVIETDAEVLAWTPSKKPRGRSDGVPGVPGRERRDRSRHA